MQYLKKYFTEGLIQVAILLSLCGVRVDVGLESYLPPSWQDMILGPTSALTQAQFHNLRNRLRDGQGLHPKSVDLDEFFTARRLLGWVRSLDRLQVPQAELETWLVQREPDPLAMGRPEQPSPLSRAPAAMERGRTAAPPLLGAEPEEDEDDEEQETPHLHHHSSEREEGEEQEEEQEEDLAGVQLPHWWTGETEASYDRDLTQNEDEQTSISLQQCLRLLEETFPFGDHQQASGREAPLSPLIPMDDPSVELELHWQDLLAILEPENTDAHRMTSPDQGARTEALHQNCIDSAARDAEQERQHGSTLLVVHSELQPTLLPLAPSAELDDHSLASAGRDPRATPTSRPPDHAGLLSEDPSEDFCMGQMSENDSATFNVNLLRGDLVENMESHPHFQNVPCLENATSCTPTLEKSDITQDCLTCQSSASLVEDEQGAEDDNGPQSPLNDLFEAASILDEIRLLDLALEDGFSPEMVARLQMQNNLEHEMAQQKSAHLSQNGASMQEGDDDRSNMAVTEEQAQPRRHQQDGEDEAESDSGLSLDFSHSTSSPCASESSSYSSSSCSSSSSSLSTVGSPSSKDEDEYAEQGSVASPMEVAVTIKQEEEEMGAVGGEFPGGAELLPPNSGDNKLLNGCPWLEHISHDHTYNQPWSSTSYKSTTRHTKSCLRHDVNKPYSHSSSRFTSETKIWSRDERRARTLKIPFSNDLIINLPVEEFNDLLANHPLSEEQLALVRDIRRRGKNKIAAQNCRKRKLGVLLGLEDDVSRLRRHRLRLLKEKQEAQRNLEEMKRRLDMLRQEVFSRLRDEEGRPLDARQYFLRFGPNGSITVASHQQGADERPRKKQKNKRK